MKKVLAVILIAPAVLLVLGELVLLVWQASEQPQEFVKNIVGLVIMLIVFACFSAGATLWKS